MASKYLTVAAAAAELGVTEEEIFALADESKLRIVRSATPVLVSALDVALLAHPQPAGR